MNFLYCSRKWLATLAALFLCCKSRAVPAPDNVFLQEIGRRIPASEPLTAVIAGSDGTWVGSGRGLARIDGDRLVDVPAVRVPVRRLVEAGGFIWAVTSPGLWRHEEATWTQVATNADIADVTAYRNAIIVAAGNRLWRPGAQALAPLATVDCPFPISRVVSFQESLQVEGAGRLNIFAGGRFGGLDMYGFPADQAWDWGALPTREIRDALAMGSRLFLATDRGVAELRGMSLTICGGAQGLPYEDTTCLAGGFTNDLWIGTTRGAIRKVGAQFHYFAGQRWLPGDRVNAIAVHGRTVWIATDRGLGVIDYVPFTLAKKAAYYERHLEEWGQKRLGLVQKLEWDDSLREFVREAGDNDGGYSGDYLVAESYRWAVTHDPVARREATNTFHALRWLEAMTGIPGFPARSVWAKGERGHKSMGTSGGYPAEWHDTADGHFEWKGDTSSDELCSHFYAVTRFLELAAEGDEIRQAKTHLARIASHLIEHHWQLIDVDGKPTRWGRWDPDYFLTEEGHYDRGLQSLELLSFIKTAEVLTGEPKFAAAYQQLVGLGYPQYTLRQRQNQPPDSVLHFLDQLGAWSYWNLIRYETDPDRHALYLRSYERNYELIRVEQQPWFNFVHHALTGDDEESAASLAHLRGWPLDLRIWSYHNAHRADLRTPPGYVALMGGTRAFSPRESEPMRWDAWTMQADGGSGGRDVVEPSSWLLAYWMGRYQGDIAAQATTDPDLLTVAHSLDREFGAKPYVGPPRPALP